MAYGSYTYNRLALGREATAGTEAARTTIWRGPYGDIEDARTRNMAEENVGLLVNAERSYDTRLAALLSMPNTELTYEQLPHILEAGIDSVTPSETVAPYTYLYEFPTSNTLNTIKTYSLEAGNAVATGDIREMVYCFVEGFTLSGTRGEAWMMSANWRGRQVAESSLTGSLSLVAVEEAIFANTSLYIDATGGTIGSTQKTGVLVAASIEVDTGIRAVFTGDGVLYFASHKFHRPSLTFTITLELETGGALKAERDVFEANTVRLIQLACPGTASRNLEINMAAKYDSVPPYSDDDGNTTVQLQGHAVYSTADSLFASIGVTNLLASLP